MSASNKLPNVDPRLKNISNSLYLDNNDNVTVRVSGIDFYVGISGNDQTFQQYSEFKNGVAPNVSQSVETSIWNENTAYPWASITSAQSLYVYSSSASDVGQVIQLDGLDSNFRSEEHTSELQSH